MPKSKETGSVDTGAKLLEQLRTSVKTYSGLQGAMKVAKLFRNDPEFARGLNAFMGFAQSDALEKQRQHVWRAGANLKDVVEQGLLDDLAEKLEIGGKFLLEQTIEQPWIDDVERGWEGKNLMVWRPKTANHQRAYRPPSARLKFQRGDTNSDFPLGTGVVVSGEVYGIDATNGGSIGLRNGFVRSYMTRSKVHGLADIESLPRSEDTFGDLEVSGIFTQSDVPGASPNRWLSSVALREIQDLGNITHPEAAVPYKA